jgi:hypothetical protein
MLTYIGFVPVVEGGGVKSVGVDTVKRRQFVVCQQELQLCDTVVVSLFIEEGGDGVESFSPISRI